MCLVGTSEYIISFQSYRTITQSRETSRLPKTSLWYRTRDILPLLYRSWSQHWFFMITIFTINTPLSFFFFPSAHSYKTETDLWCRLAAFSCFDTSSKNKIWHIVTTLHCYTQLQNYNTTQTIVFGYENDFFLGYCIGGEQIYNIMQYHNNQHRYSKMALDGCPSSQLLRTISFHILMNLNLSLALLDFLFV